MTRSIYELIGPVIAPASYPATAGQALGGHRAVIVASDNLAYLADPSVASCRSLAGLTTGAASQGSAVNIQATGIANDNTWSWADNDPVWLVSGGLLSQTPPASGYLVLVGVPVGPTQLRVAPQFIALIGG